LTGRYDRNDVDRIELGSSDTGSWRVTIYY
jgi:hypothetical protein